MGNVRIFNHSEDSEYYLKALEHFKQRKAQVLGGSLRLKSGKCWKRRRTRGREVG